MLEVKDGIRDGSRVRVRTRTGVKSEVQGCTWDGVRAGGGLGLGSPLAVADGRVLLQRGAQCGDLLGQGLDLPRPLPRAEGAVEVVGAVGGVQGEHLREHRCQGRRCGHTPGQLAASSTRRPLWLPCSPCSALPRWGCGRRGTGLGQLPTNRRRRYTQPPPPWAGPLGGVLYAAPWDRTPGAHGGRNSVAFLCDLMSPFLVSGSVSEGTQDV